MKPAVTPAANARTYFHSMLWPWKQNGANPRKWSRTTPHIRLDHHTSERH
jgi:hypothetical protein